MEDLRQMGELPGLPGLDFRDSLVDAASMEGRVVVVSRLEQVGAPRQQVIEGLSDQFTESRMVTFALFCPDRQTALAVHEAFSKRAADQPELFLIFSEADTPSMAFIAGLPQDTQTGETVLLADGNRQIRRTYQVEKEDDLKRLVEHIAIVIPPKRSPKPVLKREIEK